MRRSLQLAIIAALPLLASNARSADYVALSGQELYVRFCASCHGATGRGDGPVAKSLRVEVPDLALIATRAGGKFPRERVVRIIDGRHIIGAHGSRTMPVWGEDLSRIEIGNPEAERTSRTVMERLAEFVGTLQRPSRE
jgi:mono/diheme cytochrome c family protein